MNNIARTKNATSLYDRKNKKKQQRKKKTTQMNLWEIRCFIYVHAYLIKVKRNFYVIAYSISYMAKPKCYGLHLSG